MFECSFLYFILKVDFYYQYNKFNWQSANKKLYICHYFYTKITPIISLWSRVIKSNHKYYFIVHPTSVHKNIFMAMLFLWDKGRTRNNANHLLDDCLLIKHELLARFDCDLLLFYFFLPNQSNMLLCTIRRFFMFLAQWEKFPLT